MKTWKIWEKGWHSRGLTRLIVFYNLLFGHQQRAWRHDSGETSWSHVSWPGTIRMWPKRIWNLYPVIQYINNFVFTCKFDFNILLQKRQLPFKDYYICILDPQPKDIRHFRSKNKIKYKLNCLIFVPSRRRDVIKKEQQQSAQPFPIVIVV